MIKLKKSGYIHNANFAYYIEKYSDRKIWKNFQEENLILLGGVYGGIGGAIGMTIGDLLDPVYIIYAPKTFLLKFCIGLVTGLIAHKIGKISTSKDTRHVFKWSLIAAICGMLFNVIFDPLIGYFYKRAILGKPAAEVALAWNITTTGVNAVLSVIAAVAVYMALCPALKKSGLLLEIK